jgi:DNA-binding response OmpR family regulator
MARILIVEDDDHIRASLKLLFESEGHVVDDASNGDLGLDAARRIQPDVAIVDIMLPTITGFETCAQLRAMGDMPIVIVSARDDTTDVVHGLESGADDYVTKPFVPIELLARVKAHLRRHPEKTTRPFSVGVLHVIPDEGRVLNGAGNEMHLTATEFRLLLELAAAEGKVLSREELLEKVWGYDYFGDTRLVDVHTRRLRMKIEPDPANPTYLQTVRGSGYKLVL